MKILEELKAAQAIIDKAKSNDWDTPNGFLKLEGEHWAIDISSMDEDHIRNVLRRIPQLIEVVEWIEQKRARLLIDQANLSLDWSLIDKESQEKQRLTYQSYREQMACQMSLMLELLEKLEPTQKTEGGKEDE